MESVSEKVKRQVLYESMEKSTQNLLDMLYDNNFVNSDLNTVFLRYIFTLNDYLGHRDPTINISIRMGFVVTDGEDPTPSEKLYSLLREYIKNVYFVVGEEHTRYMINMKKEDFKKWAKRLNIFDDQYDNRMEFALPIYEIINDEEET